MYFLLGKITTSIEYCSPPGPLKRWLAFRFCELTQREVEYLAVSRDTSESDIKQRK